MCGIVGIVSKRNNGFFLADTDLFTEMLRADTIRGDDSTGVFGVGMDGGVDSLKGTADGYVFTRTTQYGDFLQRMRRYHMFTIGHNRKATRGTVSPENAHPFREGNITLVHNGTLFNAKSLNNEVEVDSHAIAHALNDHDAETALGKLDGAYALVWYDSGDRTLNLARNKQRPLFVAEWADYWTIQSEIGLVMWLRGREGHRPLKWKEVTAERIVTFSLDNTQIQPVEREFKEYRLPVRVYPPVPAIEDFTRRQGRHPSYPPFPPPYDDDNAAIPLFGNAIADRGVRAGDTLRVVFEDDKEENGKLKFVGHPMFGGELDKNICVEYYCPSGEVDAFTNLVSSHNGVFSGKVNYIRTYRGVPIVSLVNVKPVIRVQSISGELLSEDEINQVVGGGCPRCKGGITREELGETLVQRKKAGHLRIVCGKCLQESVKHLNPTVEQPSVH